PSRSNSPQDPDETGFWSCRRRQPRRPPESCQRLEGLVEEERFLSGPPVTLRDRSGRAIGFIPAVFPSRWGESAHSWEAILRLSLLRPGSGGLRPSSSTFTLFPQPGPLSYHRPVCLLHAATLRYDQLSIP